MEDKRTSSATVPFGGGRGGFKICEAIEDMQMNISGNPLREIQQLPQKQYKY